MLKAANCSLQYVLGGAPLINRMSLLQDKNLQNRQSWPIKLYSKPEGYGHGQSSQERRDLLACASSRS